MKKELTKDSKKQHLKAFQLRQVPWKLMN